MQTQFPSTTTYASLGQRLRAHRIARKLGAAQVAAKLRLSVDIIEAMERDEHVSLGTALTARACLCSYARLVDVPLDAVESQFAHTLRDRIPTEPVPVEAGIASFWNHAGRPGIQLVFGAAIALLFGWMALHGHAEASPGATTSEPHQAGSMASQATSFATSLDIGQDGTQVHPKNGVAASLVPPDEGRTGAAGAGARGMPEADPSNYALSSGGSKKPPLH